MVHAEGKRRVRERGFSFSKERVRPYGPEPWATNAVASLGLKHSLRNPRCREDGT